MPQMKQLNNKTLKEHLSANDLKWLVDDSILIDMHKTKLGEDKDYIVVSIPVQKKTPAHDLARFLETGVHKFEDVEVSAAMDTQGRYLVYLEMHRSPEAYNTVKGLLDDTSKLSGIESWKFKTLGLNDYVPFDQESFNQYVVVDPTLYEQRHPVAKQTDTEPETPEPEENLQQEYIKSRLKFLLNY